MHPLSHAIFCRMLQCRRFAWAFFCNKGNNSTSMENISIWGLNCSLISYSINTMCNLQYYIEIDVAKCIYCIIMKVLSFLWRAKWISFWASSDQANTINSDFSMETVGVFWREWANYRIPLSCLYSSFQLHWRWSRQGYKDGYFIPQRHASLQCGSHEHSWYWRTLSCYWTPRYGCPWR